MDGVPSAVDTHVRSVPHCFPLSPLYLLRMSLQLLLLLLLPRQPLLQLLHPLLQRIRVLLLKEIVSQKRHS